MAAYLTHNEARKAPGAVTRNRTGDLFLTMEMLYQLSYDGLSLMLSTKTAMTAYLSCYLPKQLRRYLSNGFTDRAIVPYQRIFFNS